MHATATSSRLRIKRLVLAALMLALAYVLPFFTGNIPQIGSMLLPMHLPVLLCGFLCGGPWGALVGFIAPLMRSVLTGGFPPMFTALAMAFELAAYGFLAGLLYRRLPHSWVGTYTSLVAAMIGGRIVWGIVEVILLTSTGSAFTFAAFVAGAFTNAIPGIILQLVALPAIVRALDKANLIPQE